MSFRIWIYSAFILPLHSLPDFLAYPHPILYLLHIIRKYLQGNTAEKRYQSIEGLRYFYHRIGYRLDLFVAFGNNSQDACPIYPTIPHIMLWLCSYFLIGFVFCFLLFVLGYFILLVVTIYMYAYVCVHITAINILFLFIIAPTLVLPSLSCDSKVHKQPQFPSRSTQTQLAE